MCLPPAAEPPTPKKILYLAYISTKGSRSVLIYTSAYLSCHDLFFHLLGLLNLLPSTTLTAVLAWDCHGNTYMHESVWDRERETWEDEREGGEEVHYFIDEGLHQ